MTVLTRRLDSAETVLLVLRKVDAALELVQESPKDRVRRIDGILHRRVTETQTPTGVKVARVWTQLGTWPSHVTVISLGFVRTLRSDDPRYAVFGVGSMLGTTIFYNAVKLVVNRTRPDIQHHLVKVHDSSFPSGHAGTSAAAMRSLHELYGVPKPICAAAALGTAFTRVYLGVHHPSDVIVGFLIGWTWPGILARLLRLHTAHPSDIDTSGPDA